MSFTVRLEDAAVRLGQFVSGSSITGRIVQLEERLHGMDPERLKLALPGLAIDSSLLEAALTMKTAAGQINTLLHAIGIVWSLPYVLVTGERVRSVSLGAGNSPDRHFDLETDRQIAEFTFIRWRGGSEPARKNKLFANLVTLDLAKSEKRRVLYVVGKRFPMTFLNGRSSIAVVLNRHGAVWAAFQANYGSRYSIVGDYYTAVRDRIELVDLAESVPQFQLGLVPNTD